MVTANLNTPLMVGQTDNTLTCDVSGADDLTPTIAYQWTRDGVTVQSGSSNTFNFFPLRLSLAGQSLYACSATVASNLLNGNIQASDDTTQTVVIQSELELKIQCCISCHSDIIIILFSNSSKSRVCYSHC